MPVPVDGKRKSAQLEADELYSGSSDESPVITSPQGKKCKLNVETEVEIQSTAPTDSGSGVIPGNDAPSIAIDPPHASAQNAKKMAEKVIKHHKYWSPSGDILVQIKAVRFKLHKSILIEQSKWFRDMIEHPPHDSCIYADEETGSTVYCLDSLDVTVEDFVTLLTALSNAVSYAFNPPPLKFVMTLLHVAHALGFDQFKTFAISYLENEWSDKLANFSREPMQYATDTIRLAQRLNINSVLKRAIYELLRADGFGQKMGFFGATDSSLNTSELLQLVHAREQLVICWMRQAVLPPDASVCHGPRDNQAYKRCAAFTGKAQTIYNVLVHDTNIFKQYRFDPIAGLKVLCDAPWVADEVWSSTYPKTFPTVEKDYLCSACGRKWRGAWRSERKKLWDNLDIWFSGFRPRGLRG